MLRPTALVMHPSCMLHDAGPAHPESRARLPALLDAVHADPALCAQLTEHTASPATEDDLLRAHTRKHIERVRGAIDEAERCRHLVWLDEDTSVSAASWPAALAAAGCAIDAAQRVLDGVSPTAFALARPPGHHATGSHAMGFCLFNNVAIAIRRLQAERRLSKAMVIDLDAHHGNGTQEIFYEDPSVYVLSLHLDGDYPGTGAVTECGAAAGLGTTRNVPLPHGTSATLYRTRFREALTTALSAFKPELVFFSAGFDGLAGDPEGSFALEPRDLHVIATDLLALLPPETRGRAVGVLEGGYAVDRIGKGLVNVLRAWSGLPASQ